MLQSRNWRTVSEISRQRWKRSSSFGLTDRERFRRRFRPAPAKPKSSRRRCGFPRVRGFPERLLQEEKDKMENIKIGKYRSRLNAIRGQVLQLHPHDSTRNAYRQMRAALRNVDEDANGSAGHTSRTAEWVTNMDRTIAAIEARLPATTEQEIEEDRR